MNMNDTPNLALPYILAAQAQKHVTHNEAIRALDCLVQLAVESRALTAPPSSPAEGARYIVAAAPSGAWTGNAGKIAAFQDGAWIFYAPKEGWTAWIADESALVIYAAGAWTLFAGSGGGGGLSAPVANSSLANMATSTIKGRTSDGSGAPEDLTGAQATALLDTFVASGASHKKGLVPTPGSTAGTTRFLREDATWADLANVPLVGVNATADATNKLAIQSPASLFDNTGNGHQQKINKAAASDTASVLYQTNYSGRAEIGTTGDDDFHFKVSPDGSNWYEGIRIARSNGRVSFPSGGAREVLAANRTYYVRTDGSDSNTGLANTTGGAFKTIQKAVNVALALDCATYAVVIQVADGTYNETVVMGSPMLNGTLRILGNTATPTNVMVNGVTDCFQVTNNATLTVQGFGLVAAAGRYALYSNASGAMFFDRVDFGATTGHHVMVSGIGLIQGASGQTYTISGGATRHLSCTRGGAIYIGNMTVTITGTPALLFAYTDRLSQIDVASNTFIGSATGNRYSVTQNGLINTNGGGASYLPGSGSGTISNGGLYL
ncbi:MAG: DUF2793 domain-containing protein [Proteobacteria bacterium]|nr:DUF2793 domain-containing protein [Pseudomonadota bacterium]